MAVVVKNSQMDEAELICGVSNDCVMLEPAKLEPEPVNFINVQNGMYEADLYAEPTYQTLTPYQPQFGTANTSQLETAGAADEFNNTEIVEQANTEMSEHSSSTMSVPVQDYYEIQVAEEEVVSDNWNVDHTEVVVENSKPIKSEKVDDDLEIPLPENQDMYSHLHPYPCDFCSRRFSHKSSLMSHMISHQTERPHGCNLCGARYRRKNDLVNHMKIHALPPVRNNMDEEGGGGDHAKNRRKKAQSLAPKRNSFSSSEYGEFLEFKEEKKPVKNRLMKKGHKSLPSKMKSHIDDDLRMLAELSRNSDLLSQEPRWPVIDQSRPYVCQHCGVGFAREKALASHSRIHGGDSPFECSVCGEMFWSVVLLREHCRSKHPQLESSPSAADPTTPTDEYKGDDRFGTFFCETCGISFYRLDLLRKHRRCHFKIEEPLQEVGDDDHVCMVCGQFFENASELRIHTETHLDSPETHRCIVCSVNFSDARELNEHVRTNHTDVATDNTCNLCGKVCKDRRALDKHACLQAENRSFPCYSCNKRFHSRARLRRHMVSHRDKAVSCSDCGEEFPDGRALMSHRHSHNSNNHPARSFPCHDCGKTFGSRSSQQIHVRIHTGERPYGCHYCWKAFADGGTLRKHERIHTGEKPYVCPICPKAFNQRVVLREHIRAHHSGSDSKVNSCYECKVCGYLFSSSSELCVHLVQHSDENTAKHRLPNMGPRKYKRRRKLGVPSPVKAPPSPPRDFESTDSSDSMIESKPVKKTSKKKYSYDSPSSPNRDLERSVVESFESAIDNIQSIVKSEPKKSKIDKLLMKKHKTKALSKLTKLARIEKRAKAAKLLNNTSYASKYVVSRPEEKLLDGQNRPRTKNVSYPTLEDSLETILNGSEAFRNRPRTKNVNYHNMKPTKLEPATFPLKGSKSKKSRESKKKTYVKKEKSRHDKPVSGVLNGSKSCNELEESYVSEEKLETCIVDDFNIEGVHAEVKPEDMPLLMDQKIESVMIKTEILTCEICGDGFADRSELLDHIRVHI